MRNVFLALLATFTLLLAACDSTAPKALTAPDTCKQTSTTDCSSGDGNNGGTDNGGTNNGGTDNGGTDGTGGSGDNGGNDGGGTTPAFNPSRMKGFVEGYQGNKRLTVKAMWIDQSTGQVINITENGGDFLELNGEFGISLMTPSAASLVTVPLPLSCGSINTTTQPDHLNGVQGLLVPALFVFDGDELVGVILNGSYHVDANGNIVPSAKLAMRVYSATDKIISQGTCTGDDALELLGVPRDATVGEAINQLGLDNMNISDLVSDALQALNLPSNLDVDGFVASLGLPTTVDLAQFAQDQGISLSADAGSLANLELDLGLKKGWNSVVISADATGNSLNLKIADDTKPNFKWYFVPVAQF
jgi:hypothetical protein